jgi:NADH-quinone oxidoreductase subunit H
MFDWIAAHIPPWAFIAVVVHLAVLGTVAYMILLERKVASWAQDRIGPNRVGPWGLLQPIADGLKFFLKEDYRPGGVDKYLFTLAPVIMIVVIIISIAVIPWGGTYQTTRANVDVTPWLTPIQKATIARPDPATPMPRITAVQLAQLAAALPPGYTVIGVSDLTAAPAGAAGGGPTFTATLACQYPFQAAKLNIGVLFVIVTLSLAIYGVVLGGWASNNKYSFFGGLRAAAQMVSYEIPLGLSLLCVVIMFGTLELDEIVERQAHTWLGFIPAWNVFVQPVAFILFLICIHAEANRAPFDLAECEQELVGGYHTEYSSMRFAMFFLAEYAGMITTSAVCVALFLGGWHLWGLAGPADQPGVTTSPLIIALRCAVFFGKTMLVIFLFMWVRWSLPRFRFDQLMLIAWRGLVPLSLALLMLTAVVVYLFAGSSELFRQTRQLDGWLALCFLVANVLFVAAAMAISRILPAPPPTNRRIVVANSRFNRPEPQRDGAGTTPLPGPPLHTS